jgi:hypothetical protein
MQLMALFLYGINKISAQDNFDPKFFRYSRFTIAIKLKQEFCKKIANTRRGRIWIATCMQRNNTKNRQQQITLAASIRVNIIF